MGLSPIQAGLYIMIAVVPLILVIPLGGWLSDRTGPRLPVCLGLLLTFSFHGLVLSFPQMSGKLLIPGMIAFGSGVAFIFAPISSSVVGGVAPEKGG